MAEQLMERRRTIREMQQDFASNSGYQRRIIWDLLAAEESDVLKTKIKQLIPNQEKGQKSIEEMRETLFTNVWAQRKYTNGNSLSAIIYVFVTNTNDLNEAENSTDVSCHPVFRTRRCIKGKSHNDKDDSDDTDDDDDDNEGTADCCMVFIDETGRVYQNWQSYISENVLPECIMVAPKNGIYTFGANGEVELESNYTPAGLPAAKILNVADTTTAAAGFAAACVPLAALIAIPVAPVVMTGAAVVGVTAAGYSIVRSAVSLFDRSKHDQSNGLENRQARNNWIGLAAGTVGLGAMGATQVLTKVAATGTQVSAGTQLLVNGMNISSIVLSGTGVANGVLDLVLKYQDNEEIGALDVLQLSASLVLFTHSVHNFRLASNIINETRQNTIQSYRNGLSNRQRRMFDKMTKETIRIKGIDRARADIIRTTNDIGSTKYLNDLHKVNEQLNQRNVRPSFGGDNNGILLNNEVSVDTAALRANLQHNVGVDIVGQVTQPIPQNLQANLRAARGFGSTSTNSESVRLLNNNRSSIPVEGLVLAAGVQVIGLSSLFWPNGDTLDMLQVLGRKTLSHILNADSFERLLTDLANNFCIDVTCLLIRILRQFIETNVDRLEELIGIFISSESVLNQIFNLIVKKYSIFTYEFLQDKEDEIIKGVKKWFKRLNPQAKGPEIKCQICQGTYKVVTL